MDIREKQQTVEYKEEDYSPYVDKSFRSDENGRLVIVYTPVVPSSIFHSVEIEKLKIELEIMKEKNTKQCP